MPKRVIDFDALWASDKLAACAEWAQAEYAWLYGLADASGSFELTNLRVIWGRVAAIRRNLTLERLEQIFGEFIAHGLLFTWEENGKRYGHWTGSDVPGRLPPPSWRARLERLAPPVPRAALAEYAARFGGREAASARAAEGGSSAAAAFAPIGEANPGAMPAQSRSPKDAGTHRAHSSLADRAARGGLKDGLERAQAQDLDLDVDWNREAVCVPAAPADQGSETPPATEDRAADPAEAMLAIYAAERGGLPPAERLTPERRVQCALRVARGLSLGDFRRAVRRAAATPFLSGGGERGWRASFDWLIANDTNARRVLEGHYAPGESRSRLDEERRAWMRSDRQRAPSFRDAATAAELRAGVGPDPAACGVRLSESALARIRARYGGAGEAEPGEAAVSCAEMDGRSAAAAEEPCSDRPPEAPAGGPLLVRKGVA